MVMRNQLHLTRIFLLSLLLTCFIRGQSNRDRWQQPERIMETIGVLPGMVIGEAGAGEGYFTFKLAQRVGEEGIIIANDIDRDALQTLAERADREKIKNIRTIVGELTDPLFPDGKLDMLIMVYVFHHLASPRAFLESIKSDLKLDAPLVLVEGDPEKYYGEGHFYTREKVIKLVTSAGYSLTRIETFLPRDTIYIFKLNEVKESEHDSP